MNKEVITIKDTKGIVFFQGKGILIPLPELIAELEKMFNVNGLKAL